MTEKGARQTGMHVSILYFHGMGKPRRYEELSRFIDTLDRFSGTDPDRLGKLRGQAVGFESSPEGEDPIAFFKFSRFRFSKENNKSVLVGRYRLYENYWSPAVAGGVGAFGVLLWLLTRTIHPFRVLFKPWRAHQRFKRSHLNEMFYERGSMPAERFKQLGALYRDFEGMDARRRWKRGSRYEFGAFIEERYPDDPQARNDLLLLATTWFERLERAQLGVACLGITLLGFSLGIAIWFTYLIAFGAHLLGLAEPLATAILERAGSVSISTNSAFALLFVIVAIGTRHFLELYLSDVVYWTTTLEKDMRYQRRREILSASEGMLLHVLHDPRCERVVVVGHSLGTAIALQTLLRLGRRTMLEDGIDVDPALAVHLAKISHFVTLGSPIDRISYFFQMTTSRYHRFNRVADQILGSAGDPPFRKRQGNKSERQIQWINIRDKADPIASRIFAARGPIPNREHIQEVEVASSHVPAPGQAHSGYFESELAAKLLFDTCILGRESLQLQQDRPRWSFTVATLLRLIAWIIAIGAAWSIAIGAGAFVLNAQPVVTFCRKMGEVGIVALIVVCLAGALADRGRSLRLP